MYDFLDKNPKPSGFYDRVYSLGSDCRVKEAMRFCYIGCKRGPFDWMLNYTLKSLVQVLKNDFEGFFLEQNLVPYPDDWNHMRILHDYGSKFTSRHDFAKEESVAEAYPAFRTKLDGIIAAFKADLKVPQKILFVLHLEMSLEEVCTSESPKELISLVGELTHELEKLCGENLFDLQIITYRSELLSLANDRIYVNLKPLEPLTSSEAEWMVGNEQIFWMDLLAGVKLNDPLLRKGYDSIQSAGVILESERNRV